VTITWLKVADATSYIVHYRLSSEEEWINSEDLGDVNEFTISDLNESTNYDVSVTALND
jgi:hypothetical protein